MHRDVRESVIFITVNFVCNFEVGGGRILLVAVDNLISIQRSVAMDG